MLLPQEPLFFGPVVTVDEVAERLNMDPESVRELLNAGDLPYRDLNGEMLISENDLEQYRTDSRIRAERVGSHEVPQPLIYPPERE